MVPGDRRMREIGQLLDKAHRAGLRQLGHPPLNDLDFRHKVADALFTRLRAERWVDYLPGLAA
jgi:hypothetical protein